MRRVILASMGIVLTATIAFAQDAAKPTADLKDAKEILKKADAATKKITAVKYKGRFKDDVVVVQGDVTLSGDDGLLTGKFLAHVRAERKSASEPLKLTIGSDKETFYLIDHKNKMVHADIDRFVFGNPRDMNDLGTMAASVLMQEFVHPTPFQDEINGESAELLSAKTVAGVECYVVKIKYATSFSQTATWYFGKKDFLPRRVERVIESPDGRTLRSDQQVAKLEVKPKIKDGAFKLVVPDGFTKTDTPAGSADAKPPIKVSP